MIRSDDDNLPRVASAHDAFGARGREPEHVEVEVGKCCAEGLREGGLEDAADLERVCVCAVQGRRNGEADVVVGLGCGSSDPSRARARRHGFF